MPILSVWIYYVITANTHDVWVGDGRGMRMVASCTSEEAARAVARLMLP